LLFENDSLFARVTMFFATLTSKLRKPNGEIVYSKHKSLREGLGAIVGSGVS
jgi:hypothetical protein